MPAELRSSVESELAEALRALHALPAELRENNLTGLVDLADNTSATDTACDGVDDVGSGGVTNIGALYAKPATHALAETSRPVRNSARKSYLYAVEIDEQSDYEDFNPSDEEFVDHDQMASGAKKRSRCTVPPPTKRRSSASRSSKATSVDETASRGNAAGADGVEAAVDEDEELGEDGLGGASWSSSFGQDCLRNAGFFEQAAMQLRFRQVDDDSL